MIGMILLLLMMMKTMMIIMMVIRYNQDTTAITVNMATVDDAE